MPNRTKPVARTVKKPVKAKSPISKPRQDLHGGGRAAAMLTECGEHCGEDRIRREQPGELRPDMGRQRRQAQHQHRGDDHPRAGISQRGCRGRAMPPPRSRGIQDECGGEGADRDPQSAARAADGRPRTRRRTPHSRGSRRRAREASRSSARQGCSRDRNRLRTRPRRDSRGWRRRQIRRLGRAPEKSTRARRSAASRQTSRR